MIQNHDPMPSTSRPVGCDVRPRPMAAPPGLGPGHTATSLIVDQSLPVLQSDARWAPARIQCRLLHIHPLKLQSQPASTGERR